MESSSRRRVLRGPSCGRLYDGVRLWSAWSLRGPAWSGDHSVCGPVWSPPLEGGPRSGTTLGGGPGPRGRGPQEIG